MSKSTQVEKIIRTMARDQSKEWWYAPDFQRYDSGELFVGYEASARMSDLTRMYPYLVHVKREGKYRYIKLREDKDIFNSPSIPKEIKELIRFERTGQARLV